MLLVLRQAGSPPETRPRHFPLGAGAFCCNTEQHLHSLEAGFSL